MCARGGAVELEERWVYVSTNLLLEDNVEAMLGLIDTAAAAGATHIQLSDYQTAFMGDMPPRYFDNVAIVKRAARDANVIIVPAIFPAGSSGRYLYHNPNLADGIPVRGMRFVVEGATANVDGAFAPEIANAGFDAAEGDTPAGWTVSVPAEGPVPTVTLDTVVKQAGAASLKITGAEAEAEAGGGRRSRQRVDVSQVVDVRPFQAYTLDVWMKTEGVRPERHPVQVRGVRDGRQLCFSYFMRDPRPLWPPAEGDTEVPLFRSEDTGWVNNYPDFGAQPTGDWQKYRVTFNSLDYDQIELVAGAPQSSTGTIWFDEIELKPSGLLNVLRRELTPLEVTSADGSVVYIEGVDFKRVEDPKLGVAATRGDFMTSSHGTFDVWHSPPAIRLAENSRIKDGDVILVSFYSPGIVYVKQQVTVSMSDPLVFDYMEQEIAWAARVWDSPCYLMNYDEIRSGGWEPQPDGGQLTPGELLALHIARAVEIARKHVGDARLYVWSDMFDPYHNARELGEGQHYYLVNGSWHGSWEGLPSDVIIYNWGGGRSMGESLKWFADRGHQQVISGFPPERWLEAAEGLPGIIGVSYTTWTGDYSGMGEFFKSALEWTPGAAP